MRSITRTAQLGDINEAELPSRLFVTFNRPHKAASRDTLSRWIRNLMTAAGVDTAMYSRHSMRGAGTSASLRRGLPIDKIVKTAG